jgi:hypothetical protein
VNDEVERIKREAVVDNKVLSQNLPGQTEESSLDNRSPGRHLNPGPPEYEAGLLTTRQQRSMGKYLSKLLLRKQDWEMKGEI